MERSIKPVMPLSQQMIRRTNAPIPVANREHDGNTKIMISTGSTLLDLAISGGLVKGGGLPGGILVEVFGPNASGKTVLLSEIAGGVQRKGGDIMFHDPEARLNKQFAALFDLKFEKVDYHQPDTVTELFQAVRDWKPTGKGINGVFADSLAALSTNMEMDNDEGDKMGGRRAKEFSEQLRKTCRMLVKNNYLMVASNQIRQNMDAQAFQQKWTSPGGEAIGFYSSLRLKTRIMEKIKEKIKMNGKEMSRVTGIRVEVEVFKSSVWKPYHIAPVTILFDYGIDDIRENLQFIKDNTRNTMYTLGERKLAVGIKEAVSMIELEGLERKLRNEVIALWEDIEKKFENERKPKHP